MNFTSIPIINLHDFIIVVDQVRHKDNSLRPKLLHRNRLSRKPTTPNRSINQQIRRRHKLPLLLIFNLPTKLQRAILHQIKHHRFAIGNISNIRIGIGYFGIVEWVDGGGGD